jgi:hypothetical protein
MFFMFTGNCFAKRELAILLRRTTMMSFRKATQASHMLLAMCFLLHSPLCLASAIAGELVIVPTKQLPEQARVPAQAMLLSLVNPTTLYLYLEENNGQKLAIFDVSDPHKIKFKKLVQTNAGGTFDFVQPAGQSLELIRYRDGRGARILDFRDPKTPFVTVVGAAPHGCSVLPVNPPAAPPPVPNLPMDYAIFAPTSSKPVAIVKNILQQVTDEGNGTVYLLGTDGLTVIRNIKGERRLAATAPSWNNTIDDD